MSIFANLTSTSHAIIFRNIDLGPHYKAEGYPSRRVNPMWRANDSPGLQAKFNW